jgi:hypothetical protein
MPFNPFLAHLCYDPRDAAQRLDDRTTWKRSTNGILIAATMLYVSRDSFPVSWEKVAVLADMSEEPEMQATEASRPTVTLEQTNRLLESVLSKRETDFA